ncbi:YDG domain-containing protein [Halopseudomonas oceani]|uniref:YDG domain-containing protein n=1 Tax=Halopseudomonas oceani TaxID=1708783 RepID=UPI002AA73084|nr:YDG domain-containing protein [Halopseudomonas oceani]
MNHIFKTVFNAALGVWQAVSELARGCGKGRGKQGSGTLRGGQWRGAPGVLLLLCAAPGTVLAASLPQNGQVIAGDVSISQPSDHTLTIEQGSNKAIIDWQSFSIGEGNTVNFDQHSSSAVALNRVTGNDPSAIYGNLNATGKVFLVNQNGVLFAEGANVNVGGLVASTLDIDNQDFVDGNYRFEGSGNQAVINRGTIHADGGAVVMLGGQVSNDGVIRANLGNVAMAAGEKIQLDFAGDGLINLTIEQGKLNALVENHGAIQADGGSVYLTTHAADQVLDSVVNNSGQIRAQTVAERDGKIVLLADMQSGTATIDGTLDASAPDSGDGGFIETSGAHVTIADSTQITTQAEHGDTGTWLIDPNDFTIAASGGDITGATLSNQLASTDVEIQSVNGATDGNGDVFVNDSVSWNDNTLTLSAERDIHVNESLNASGTAGLALKYGQGSSDGVINGTEAQYRVTAPINLASTGSFSTQLGSAGSVIDYTIITDVNALQDINSGLTGYYVLGADIDASATAGWNSGAGFNPLGSTYSNSFQGVFDGLGHVISGLFINRGATDFVGLFGYTDGAALRQVGLENVDITGRDYVGALVGGQYNSRVSQSYVSGSVNGEYRVGGLVGDSFANSRISQSYATAAVTGTLEVGGLVGHQFDGSISQSYATGAVTGSNQVGGLVGLQNGGNISQSYATGAVTGAAQVGGLVAYQDPIYSSITNSYWNTETTGQATSAGGGTGLTTEQMFSADSFTGFEFGEVWGNAGDQTTPYLLGLSGNQVFNRHDLPTGAITASNRPDAYNVILTLQQLQAINSGLTSNYVLGADIDASATAGWNSGAGFVPIGDDANRFSGVFDGLGHVISGLFIDRNASDHTGLFGFTNGATLRQVGLDGVDVRGSRYVGGLVGYSRYSNITQSYVSGVVQGLENVGGLIGHQEDGGITQSYATSRVQGSKNVGGLVGWSEGALIRESYAVGSVAGDDWIGGLVGLNRGGIRNSYATGAVEGGTNVGGLVGQTFFAIVDSHWDSASTGQIGSGASGGVAEVTASNRYNHSAYQNLGTWEQLYGDVYIAKDGSGNPTWAMIEGSTRPFLYSEYSTTIRNAHQLQLAALDLTADYTLAADIDAGIANGSNDSGMWSTAGFDPIGDLANRFGGGLDGLGHVIGDLFIDRRATDYVGLFGYTDGARLRHVGLENIDITGRSYVAGLVGNKFDGDISNAYVTGRVTGAEKLVGGLVGMQWGSNASISDAYATSTVTGGGDFVGGLIGFQEVGSHVSHSYATGTVIGGRAVGGLIGAQRNSSVSQSYATGAVTGADRVGGLIGFQATSTISDSYYLLTGDRTVEATAGLITTLGGVKVADNVSGATLSLKASGDVNVSDSVSLEDNALLVEAEGDVHLAAGAVLSSDAAGDALVLSSNAFINEAGSAAVQTSHADGRWLIYSDNPDDNTFGGLASGNQALWNTSWSGSPAVTAPGNRYVFAMQPTLTVTDNVNYTKTYGDIFPTPVAGTDYTLSGFVDAGIYGNVFTQDDASNIGAPTLVSAGAAASADAADYALTWQVGDLDATGYNVDLTATGGTLTVTPKVIDLINAIAQNKVYDGSTDADVTADLSGVIGGDDLQLALAGAFDNKNAGTGKTVTVSGLLSGADAGNYALSANSVTTTASISAKVIDLINAVAQHKVYDGTTDADVTAGLGGVISGDDLQLALAGAFDNKNAGTGKTVTVSGALSGADVGNYTLSANSVTTTADISAKVIDLINAVAQHKVYDGTTDADVTADLGGVISGDDLQLALAGAFDNKNAGTGKTVTVSGALSGADVGNYTLSANSVTTTASISAKVIDLINAVAQHKVYDGTTDADVTADLSGVISGDDLQLALAGAFDNKNAGTGKTVTVSGMLSGADAGNYALSANSVTTTADISAKVIDLINVAAQNKIYDGTTDADVTAGLGGVVSGDDLRVNLSAWFADAEIGQGKTVTVSGVLDGADSHNYQLNSPIQILASILAYLPPQGYQETIDYRAPQQGAGQALPTPEQQALQLEVQGDGLNLSGLGGAVTLTVPAAPGRPLALRLNSSQLQAAGLSGDEPGRTDAATQGLLGALAAFLKANPEARVQLMEQAGEVGANVVDPQRFVVHAQSVAKLLQRFGVSAEQLQAGAADKPQPFGTDTLQLAMAVNRRADAQAE